MSVAKRLTKMLAAVDVPYGMIYHHRANTAAMAAVAEHVPPHEHAKAVLFRADGKNIMAVLPADNEYIVFSAGSHKESLRMKFADYEKIARPIMGSFSAQ